MEYYAIGWTIKIKLVGIFDILDDVGYDPIWRNEFIMWSHALPIWMHIK